MERKRKPATRKASGSDIFTRICSASFGTECVREYRFHPRRMWRFDYALPAHRIALEVEGGVWTGGRHTSPSGFLRDMEKYNTATVMGWRVLRCVPETLCATSTLDMIAALIEGKTPPPEGGRAV